MPIERKTLIKRTVVCEACGGPVPMEEDGCPYCGSSFEPMERDPNKLPSAIRNEYARSDAEQLLPFLEQLLEFHFFRPREVSELLEIIKPMVSHGYPYRDYLARLVLSLLHFRSVCLDNNQESRSSYLELFTMIDAIYTSLTN